MGNQVQDVQSRSPRILFLTDRYAPSIGGVERQCNILVKEFARRGSKILIVTDRYLLSLPSIDHDDGVFIYRIWSLSFLRRFMGKFVVSFKEKFPQAKGTAVAGGKSNEPRWPLKYLRTFYRLIFYKIPLMSFGVAIIFALARHRKEYDVIQTLQTHWLAFPAVIAGRIFSKPVVAREASINAIDALDDFPFRNHTKRMLLQHCNFVALSTSIFNNLLARGVPPARIALIPNSVHRVPQHQQIVHTPLSALFIGNIVNDPLQKGLDILLTAWQRVVKKIPDARLTIAGEGNYSEFISFARDLGILQSITFYGVSLDINALFCKHNIFVLPSRYEGMSNALLEAMSFGKACVVTAVSGSDDLISHGVNGMKVDPENESALADALVFLMTHESEARAFGNAAQEYVRLHHSPEKISQRYLDLYSHVLYKSSNQ